MAHIFTYSAAWPVRACIATHGC